MPIFGKKKEEVKLPTTKVSLPTVEDLKMNVEPFTPVEQLIKEPEKSKEEVREEKPSFAPLFIKLDRYKQILNALAEVKTTLAMIKNSFSVTNELEKLKNENLKTIQSAIERVDKKISALDSEFLRPSGYREELLEEVYGVENLETTLTDLRSQVNQLKSELESLA